MQVNAQTNRPIQVVTKKRTSVRTILNIYGFFIFFGLIVSGIITVPFSINENLEFYRNEELMLDAKEKKEFLVFIFGSASIYYFLVNLYFIGPLWRKVFYGLLILICSFSLLMIYYLLANSTSH